MARAVAPARQRAGGRWLQSPDSKEAAAASFFARRERFVLVAVAGTDKLGAYQKFMRCVLFLALIVASTTTAVAQNSKIEVRVTYNGFNLPLVLPASGKGVNQDLIGELKQPFTSSSLTISPSQRGTIELTRKVEVPGTLEKVPAGVVLDVIPTIREGQIVLTGKSIIRRALSPEVGQSLSVSSFSTREVFFNVFVKDGDSVTIHAGDGSIDKAEIIIAAKLASAQP